MNRREALSAVSFIFGGAIIGAEAFLSGCSTADKKEHLAKDMLTNDDIALLDELGETIIPTTASSPGAKATKIGEFMKTMVNDCYSEEEQNTFMEGIGKLNTASENKFSKEFMALDAGQKFDLLLDLEKDKDAGYYKMYKQLTTWGYLTSEIGATKTLRHVAVPGRFEGCIDMEPGQKAWA